jgi:hypothetical protein
MSIYLTNRNRLLPKEAGATKSGWAKPGQPILVGRAFFGGFIHGFSAGFLACGSTHGRRLLMRSGTMAYRCRVPRLQ